jgi:hypothetical protein
MVVTHMDGAPVAADIVSDAVFRRTFEPIDERVVKINIDIMVGDIEAKAALLGKLRIENALVHLDYSGGCGGILPDGALHTRQRGVIVGLLQMENGDPLIGEHIEKEKKKYGKCYGK